MNYRMAKKLHNEDEVVRKADGCPLYVLSVEHCPERHAVLLHCDDGNVYHHREIK